MGKQKTVSEKSLFQSVMIVILITASTLFLSSCPSQISRVNLNQVKDTEGPIVVILSPEHESTYTETVTVLGTVKDTSNYSASDGKIASLYYEINGLLGIIDIGTITFTEEGLFSYQFDTVDIDGPIVVRIIAQDWNGNLGEDSVILEDPGNDIPSFKVVADNHSAKLSWNAVPGAARYTVYYTTDGNLPSELYGERIEDISVVYTEDNPLELTDLINGNMHVFLLKAHASGGGTTWLSDIKRVIPLSEFTLAPIVTGEYRRISLEWYHIEGTDEFEVLRSESVEGPFENYSGSLSGYEFVDSGVEEGKWYYYKVKPSLEGSMASTFNGAQTHVFPDVDQERMKGFSTAGPVNAVKISGDLAFLAIDEIGLQIVDITKPFSMKNVALYATSEAKDVDVWGDYAYVAGGTDGLVIVDISNPTQPLFAGSWTLGGYSVEGVTTEGQYAFVTDRANDVRIIDVEPPGSAYQVAIYDVSSFNDVNDIDVHDGYLFIATAKIMNYDEYEYIIKLDATNLPSLSLYDYVTYLSNCWHYGEPGAVDYLPTFVEADDQYVYVLNSVCGIVSGSPGSNTLQVRYNSNLNLAGETSPFAGFPNDMAVYGNTVYIATGTGLQLVDVTIKTNPVDLAYWDTPGSSMGVDSNGRYGFIASGDLGFHAVDCALPNAPAVKQTYGSYGVNGVWSRGDYVYTVNSNDEIDVVNVSDPADPVSAGSSNPSLLNNPTDIALRGDYAFVTDGSSGFKIFNISDPGSISPVGSVTLSGSLSALEIKGDYAFCAAGNGLHVYDISDASQPRIVGFFDALSYMHDIVVRGDLAYVTDSAYMEASKLRIIDISNPAIMTLRDETNIGITLGGVDVRGDYAFVTDYIPIDMSIYATVIDEDASDYLFTYPPIPVDGLPYDVETRGRYVFVADVKDFGVENGGIEVVEISTAGGMITFTNFTNLNWNSCESRDIVLSGSYAYVGDATNGLVIVDLYPGN